MSKSSVKPKRKRGEDICVPLSNQDLRDFVKKNPNFDLVKSPEHGEKIRCIITGHEMKVEVGLLRSYLSSGSYKRAIEGWNDDSMFEKYLPYIVQHKAMESKLFCLVTKQELNKIPTQVENHIQGKRFQKLKAQYDKDKTNKHEKTAKEIEGKEVLSKNV